MSDVLAEQRAKRVLTKLIQESGYESTADEVFREFKKPKDKVTSRKLISVLRKLIAKDKTNQKLFDDLSRVAIRCEPFDALVSFLNAYSETVSTMSITSMASTPEISQHQSTHISTTNLSEIKEKIAQAASGRRSKTSPTTPTSSLMFPTTAVSIRSRPSSMWNFNVVESGQLQHAAGIPITSQERIILTELLYVLVGMRGNYITPEPQLDDFQPMKFKISDEIQVSVRDIVLSILPLASHYSLVQKFIQYTTASSGKVIQALSAALRAILLDYYMALNQLEGEHMRGALNLSKLMFYMNPTMSTMEVLSELIISIRTAEIGGGQVLGLLFDKIAALTGDSNDQKILVHLTRLAAVPYMETLKLWIKKGIIVDPQQEFLIEDNEIIRRQELPEHYSADYWEKRYTIRRERIPKFLASVSDIILRTGKYLNVIRQCGKNLAPPDDGKLEFCPMQQTHIQFISRAYHFASSTLLEVLMKENDLMGHLASVKRYLLLHQGDFITQFMDACEEELSKNVDQVLPMKLENLLGLTQRMSSARNDPYKDDLKCELLTYDLATQMSKIVINEEENWQISDRIDLSGLECFAFRYEVEWPISLVLNHIAISKYQMLFRQLFHCKHVERQLCKVWKENNNAKKFDAESSEHYRSAFALRQRMMNAIQNIEYYMMVEVIEPSWHTFIENIKKVENVDDVLAVHQDFLDLCLKNCMLTDPVLLRSIVRLCNICLQFCEFIQTNSELSKSETFSERVKRYDLEFTGVLLGFLNQIDEVASNSPFDKFINLMRRINFNSFYNDQMELLCVKNAMNSAH